MVARTPDELQESANSSDDGRAPLAYPPDEHAVEPPQVGEDLRATTTQACLLS